MSQIPACRAATKPRIAAATRIKFCPSSADLTAACPLPPWKRAARPSPDAFLPLYDSKEAWLFRGKGWFPTPSLTERRRWGVGIDPAGLHPVGQHFRALPRPQLHDAADGKLEMVGGTTETVVEIHVALGGVDIVAIQQARRETAGPQAFGKSGILRQLRCFRKFTRCFHPRFLGLFFLGFFFGGLRGDGLLLPVLALRKSRYQGREKKAACESDGCKSKRERHLRKLREAIPPPPARLFDV